MSDDQDTTPNRPAAHGAERPLWLVLAVITVGTFLAPLDASIVNIALPEIAAEFGVTVVAVGWISSVYALTSASIVLTMGRLGDVWGLRKVYVTGFVVFGIGSALCAFAPTLGWLIGFRVLQALGAAMMFATGPAIVANVFPPGRRGRALGVMSVAVSAGLMAGPTLGGLLVSAFGWPSIFLVNVPLEVVVAYGSWRLLPIDEPHAARFDLGGSALTAVALLSLLFAISEGAHWGWASWQTLGLVSLSAVAAIAFVRLERTVAEPMLDLTLLRNWSFSAGALSAMLTYLSYASITFLLPFFLIRVQGLEPWLAGVGLASAPVMMGLLGPPAGNLSDRRGSRELASAGLLIVALSLWAFSLLDVGSPFWLVIALGLVTGTGAALFGSPNTSAMLAETPRVHRGVGSAIVANARNIGFAIGIALSAAVVTGMATGADTVGVSGALPGPQAALLLQGIKTALRVGAVASGVGVVISWSRGRSGR